MVSGGAAAAGSRLVLESVNPHCLPCDIEQKEYAYRVSTVWGGRLSKRFCNMISGSSPCLLGQHGNCSSAQLPVELPENMLQNLFLNLPPQTVSFLTHKVCEG